MQKIPMVLVLLVWQPIALVKAGKVNKRQESPVVDLADGSHTFDATGLEAVISLCPDKKGVQRGASHLRANPEDNHINFHYGSGQYSPSLNPLDLSRRDNGSRAGGGGGGGKTPSLTRADRNS
jgi:hypothetical protein